MQWSRLNEYYLAIFDIGGLFYHQEQTDPLRLFRLYDRYLVLLKVAYERSVIDRDTYDQKRKELEPYNMSPADG